MSREIMYVHVSTTDQQTIPLQIRTLREYTARRGRTRMGKTSDTFGPNGPAPVRADDRVGYTFVHDPSMIKQGTTYYVFSTGDPPPAAPHQWGA